MKLALDQIWTDLGVAARRLASSSGFTFFSVASLALGVGAATTISSFVHAVMHPLDVADLEQIVNIYHQDPTLGGGLAYVGLSWPDYRDLRATQSACAELTAWARFREAVVGGGSTQVVNGEFVGGSYFQLLGIRVALGRLILPVDDQANAAPVAVLSDALWRRQFAADPAVVGQTIRINGVLFEVVGVAPGAFRGVDMPNLVPTAVWVPLVFASAVSGTGAAREDRWTDRELRWLLVKGRLRPGLSVRQAAAEVKAIGRRLDLAHPIGRDLPPNRKSPPALERAWHVMPAAELRIHESVHQLAGPVAAGFLAAVGLVLLVACTNLANLVLARSASRRHEMAVRASLGASRARLIGEYLAEPTIVALAGGMSGVGLARLLIAALSEAPINLGHGATMQLALRLPLSVLYVGAMATFLSLVVFGLLPALRLSRASIQNALSTDVVTAGPPRWRGRRTLIACQVSVSVALVVIAALVGGQIAAAARHDVGIDLDRLALLQVDLRNQRWSEERSRRVLETIASRASRQPGVEAVALSSGLPVGTGTPGATIATEAGDQAHGVSAELMICTPPIFRTLGVAVGRGRPLDDRDVEGAVPTAVLSAVAARAVFGTSEVVGRSVIVQRRRQWGEPEAQPAVRTIVGVAADTDAGGVGRRARGVVYVPFAQQYEPMMTIVARSSGDPSVLVAALERLARQIDAEIPIAGAGTGIVLGGAQNVALKVLAGAAGTLGLLALALAMAGLYGVLLHVVTGRTGEIGLRMALGAGRGTLMWMVLTDGLRPVLQGLVAGLGLAVAARSAMRPLFVALLPATDSMFLAGVPILFVVAGLLACYVPAAHAARVDPNIALRQP